MAKEKLNLLTYGPPGYGKSYFVRGVFVVHIGYEECMMCGTIYDTSFVDITDSIPPIGNGCEHCLAQIEAEQEDV